MGVLANVAQEVGGRKNLQGIIWVGAFNYLPLKEFLALVREFDWDMSPWPPDKEKPRLFVQQEDEWGFKEAFI